MRTLVRVASAFVLVLAFVVLRGGVGAAPAGAQELSVEKGHVAVICPLTVGGRFEAKTNAVTGQVVAAEGADALDGSFRVDLRTLDTGIGLRNEHLRDRYLEVGRGAGFDTAVLDRIRLDGADASRAQGKVPFRGMLALHGQVREVQGTAEITRDRERVKVKVHFPLKIDAFQIAKPTYLGVGVANDIKVEVEAALVNGAPHTPSR